MDVFEFRDRLIEDYERFSRSFTQIRAEDVRDAVEAAYRGGRFWPAPLIQINPNFVSGGTVDELVDAGRLDAACAKIFRIKSLDDPFGKPITLHHHQRNAIDVAQRGESYVLTTGTGSGKSLSYFIPIVDDVLRRKRSGQPPQGITAIVVYPMNALCNSQRDELEKFLKLGYGEGKEPVTFARYTGQETKEEREQIAKRPPDILLTNYVMLEQIMTRFLPTDVAIRNHAVDLRFLVLDELHTYRGRQGADVAMLVRRVRERFNENLLCIGTSATMASEGDASNRAKVVAQVATRLFGIEVKPENVITETLEPVTVSSTPIDRHALEQAIAAGVPPSPSWTGLAHHPIAAWIERRLGLEEQDGKLVRISRPRTVDEAAAMLAEESGVRPETCRSYLAEFLLKAYETRDEKGRTFFAFRLHQFVSGAWNVFTTLEAKGSRFITLDGQQFKPGDRSRNLFNLCFCRECGQEYYPAWASMADKAPKSFVPRELTERSNDDESLQYGYLMPDSEGIFDPNDIERHYPEDWLEYREGQARLKPNFRRYRPLPVQVDTSGQVVDEGLLAWFIPGPFRFCLNPDCGANYDGSVRSDLTKLSGLSSEGRSSATTVLTLASLKYLIGTDLDDRAKKILAFTDNRQDASLQAGHFNDFVQILLLRGALLAAIRGQSHQQLTDDVLTQKVLEHLHLEPADYAANPEAKGIKAQNTLKTLRDVLGYRVYFDLRRGWRITNPNLEQVKLLAIDYQGLKECCQEAAEWKDVHPLLASASPDLRYPIVHDLLDRMRKALCVKTIYLDPNFQEQLRNRSFNELKEPWGLSEDERLFSNAYMVPRAQPNTGRPEERTVHISYRSAFGRQLRAQATWHANPHFPRNFDEATYNAVIDDILRVLTTYGFVEPTELDQGRIGYRIDSSVLVWRLADGSDQSQARSTNVFRTLYDNVAKLLQDSDRFLHQLEAREHTAQVDSDIRVEREARFRKGLAPQRVVDGTVEPSGLPVLFCSPTMELGVDISTLNTVYMRNVPPTPANYAQRSGRAGRSGQPALVITYCAAKSPHDQYFFANPTRMVAGAVNPPTIDLANEDLVKSHLHAVWLAETGKELGSSVRDVLDLERPNELPLRDDIAAEIRKPSVRTQAMHRGRRILGMLEADLVAARAGWYTATWLDNVIAGAPLRFDEAFRRWRSLYRATTSQMKLANNVLNNAAATEQDRREAKARFDEAYTQQNLLLETQATMNFDFYTYRYLAAEGFLPGYNFPRLPLMAFIPGRKEKVVRDSFLSRPRFLGLSEFGPQSIIYHEGSTYRVKRAILTIRDEGSVTASAKLPLQGARLCPACGYGHFGEQREFERCVNCGEKLDGGRRISNLYRIEQVSTRRAVRITSDEEERQRQGYEMITTLRFAAENGRPRLEAATFAEGEDTLIELRYGPAATIWRINLGWRRRQDKSIYGFTIDVNTGEWSKDSQAPTDAEDDTVREGKTVERITPFVEDTRNVLILQPKILQPESRLSREGMVTLQYALKRGIEQEFQLEESELAAEPLPEPDDRRAILFYEAAEGGAGVLTRLASDDDALRRVARKALEICHYSSVSGNWTDHEDLQNHDENCEAGCYRCLLSYYNQPEHGEIDRRDPTVLDLLCRLTRATRSAVEGHRGTGDSIDELMNAAISSLEKEWLRFLKEGGYHLPDRAQPYLEAFATCPDFAYEDKQTLVYIDGPHHEGNTQKALDESITSRLEDAGFTVIRFTTDKNAWPEILAQYGWVFGLGSGGASASAAS